MTTIRLAARCQSAGSLSDEALELVLVEPLLIRQDVVTMERCFIHILLEFENARQGSKQHKLIAILFNVPFFCCIVFFELQDASMRCMSVSLSSLSQAVISCKLFQSFPSLSKGSLFPALGVSNSR